MDNHIKPKVVLVNDTSLYSPHFGCQLVGQTMREQFARVGLDLVLSLPREFEITPALDEILSNADLVIVNGEGSIHHGRNLHLLELSRKYKCALINAVYQANPRNVLNSFLYVSTRESFSAREVHLTRQQCIVVPDVIFASMLLRSFNRPSEVMTLGITDNVTNHSVGFGPDIKVVSDYLTGLSMHERLCIGRFHAAIVALVLKIPFSTWDSNTHKTRGMMYDIGISEYHFSSLEEAKQNVPTTFPEKALKFGDWAVGRVESMFDKLYEIAALQANSKRL